MADTEIWTLAQARAHFNKQKTKPHQPSKRKGNGDKAKAEMEMVLKLLGVPYTTEQVFHPTRKWRFDYAIQSKMIAIEYEGVYGGGKSRHTTAKGYSKDSEKYNEAGKLGWTILRYTATTYTNLTNDLKELLQ